MPPIVLAALRKKMVALAAEIADGVIFANASLSHMPQSLAVVPSPKRSDPNFLIGNMLPVCVSEDVDAAKALLRRRLVHYALLPNYRAYWKEAGYVDEMSAVEKAIADNRPDDIPKYLTDRWLADNTLFGPAAKVRDGVEAWRAAGVNTPVLVPNSVAGNQINALRGAVRGLRRLMSFLQSRLMGNWPLDGSAPCVLRDSCLRSFLRMRNFLNAIKGLPHAEERL